MEKIEKLLKEAGLRMTAKGGFISPENASDFLFDNFEKGKSQVVILEYNPDASDARDTYSFKKYAK